MVYAHRADIYDADTHMMESPTWLAEFADAKLRPHLTPFGQSNPAAIAEAEQALAGFAKRQQNPDLAAEIEASFMAMQHKGFMRTATSISPPRSRPKEYLKLPTRHQHPKKAP